MAHEADDTAGDSISNFADRIGPVRVLSSHQSIYYDKIREVASPAQISDEQVLAIAQAVAAQTEAERPHQRRREWMLLIIGLVAGALASIPIGILVNLIS